MFDKNQQDCKKLKFKTTNSQRFEKVLFLPISLEGMGLIFLPMAFHKAFKQRGKNHPDTKFEYGIDRLLQIYNSQNCQKFKKKTLVRFLRDRKIHNRNF